MSEVFATAEVNGKTIDVMLDNFPLDPRKEWEHDSLMVCFHRNYDLGDEHTYIKADFDSWQGLYDQLVKDGYQTILALYLYDHSGISIRAIQSFYGRAPYAEWDSGQVGFIAHKEAEKEGLLKAEVEEYDHYLTGSVVGYLVYEMVTCSHCNHTEKVISDSSWGYYSVEEALNAGKEVA
jgi:hypothetical protein